MRVRIVQKDINRTNLTPDIQLAVRAGVEVVCFGELAACGCLYEPREVESLESVVAPWRTVPIGVMFGMARREGNGLRNSYVYVQGARTQVYDKINLFAPFHEDRIFEAGTEPGFFETPAGMFGVGICYDIRFDDIFARFAERKARWIVIPAAFPMVRIGEWRELVARRAMETNAVVMGINAVGSDGVNEFGGSSMVVGPDGTVLAMADEVSEGALDIDL